MKFVSGATTRIQAHVQVIWLTETRQSLGATLKDVLDLSGEDPTLGLEPSVRARLVDAGGSAVVELLGQGLAAVD